MAIKLGCLCPCIGGIQCEAKEKQNISSVQEKKYLNYHAHSRKAEGPWEPYVKTFRLH